MRLLNVTTLQVEQFFHPNIPPYAILSHTWGRDEMTMADMETIARHRLTRKQQMARIIPRTPDKADAMRMLLLSSMLTAFRGNSPLNRPPTPPSIADTFPSAPPPASFEKALVPASLHSSHVLELKAGFSKVSYACSQAERDGFQYIWIDTCCIDKSSSAEMTEAINSMFSWYQLAGVCYAYLDDVQHGGHRGGYRIWKDDFAECRWFKRGWTLQELLAPRNITFYGQGWKQLGTKASLARTIEKATGIDRRTLLEPTLVFKASVARRMAWAARRSTTLAEDMSYCLMGVFGVTMIPLYGEGENAFVRLQEEIIKHSDDQSIFAWGILGQEDRPVIHHNQLEEFDDDSATGTIGALARSPKDFAGMERVVCANPPPPQPETSDYALTNKGLRVRLHVLQVGTSTHTTSQKYFLAALDCRHEQEDPQDRLGILLAETETPNVLVRTRTRKHTRVSGEDLETAKPRAMYILTSTAGFANDGSEEEKVVVRAPDLISPGYDVIDVQAKHFQWNREFATMRLAGMPPPATNTSGVAYQLAVVIFFNRHLRSGFCVRIIVDGASATSECYVDLVPPPDPIPPEQRKGLTREEDEDVELNQLRSQARALWEAPGALNLVRKRTTSSGKTVTWTQEVEIVNPDLYGAVDDEDDAGSVRSKRPVSGEAMDPRPGVLFKEMWEKEYHRMVEAKIVRKKKGVISLDMTSMLFAGA